MLATSVRRQPKPCFFLAEERILCRKKLQIDLKSILLGHPVAVEFDFRVQYICRYLILHQFWLDGQRISSSKLCFCTGEIACYYSTFDGKENEKSTIIVKILGFNWLDSPTFRCFQVLGSSIEKIKIASCSYSIYFEKSLNTQVCQNISKNSYRICIKVRCIRLKSLFGIRFMHILTPVQLPTPLHTPTHTRAHQRIPKHTRTPAHTSAYPDT